MAVVPPPMGNARPCEHLIQAYTDDAFLARVVAEYVGGGLNRRGAAVIIASPVHTRLFTDSLTTLGVDVPAAVAAGQMLFLDAEHTLARFMVEGRPDRTAFSSVIAAALEHVRCAGHRAVRLYGEMVDLLWQDQFDATLQLERLWNDILVDERLSLLCAYRIDALDRHADGVLSQVTHCHSRLMPADDPERFEEAVDRAYTEVFGVTGDVAALRDLMISRHTRSTAVPAAHAALFALDDMPPLIANDVRARARRHYRRGSHEGSSRQR